MTRMTAAPLHSSSTALMILAVLTVSCAPSSSPPEDKLVEMELSRPGKWPIAKVETGFGDLVVYPAADVSWTALVDLSIFDGFWPGMTGAEAEASVGKADRKAGRPGAERFWRFDRPGGSIVVAHRDKGSLFGGRWWRLDAYLDPPVEPDAILHPSVVAEMPNTARKLDIIVMNDRDLPGALLSVEDGRVVHLDWIDNPGSGGSADR